MALTNRFFHVPAAELVEAPALTGPASSGLSLAAGCRPIEQQRNWQTRTDNLPWLLTPKDW